jgi:hypothetical protein
MPTTTTLALGDLHETFVAEFQRVSQGRYWTFVMTSAPSLPEVLCWPALPRKLVARFSRLLVTGVLCKERKLKDPALSHYQRKNNLQVNHQ